MERTILKEPSDLSDFFSQKILETLISRLKDAQTLNPKEVYQVLGQRFAFTKCESKFILKQMPQLKRIKGGWVII